MNEVMSNGDNAIQQDERETLDFVIDSAVKLNRFTIFIPIIFAITGIVVVFGAIFIPDTEAGAYAFLYNGLAIGLSIMVVVYMVNWFFCLRFVKEYKNYAVHDEKLKRLLSLQKISCILFMIPITFLFGMIGFQKTKIFAKGTYRKGTLDDILYKVLIHR